jgi:RNA polymerase sigma-70 factor (sigma-E family)
MGAKLRRGTDIFVRSAVNRSAPRASVLVMMAAMASPSGPRPVTADPWLVDLYRSDYRHLVRLAAMLVDDIGTAEELVQDAFVAVARRNGGDGMRDPSAAAAYLRSAVLNRARSQLRKRDVRRRHLRSIGEAASAPSADREVLVAEEHRAVLAALDRLPDRQRQVLVLRYYGELSVADTATALGISAGSVKTHAHRGLAALEVALEER